MGSHKMKLVTVGLALATVAKALDCENGTVDMQPGGSDHIDWCKANAEKCKDSDVQVCMFSDEFDEVAETNPITMDDVNEPEPTPEPVPVIHGRRGGIAKNTEVRVTRTWVDDVEEYCRVNKKACKNQWGSRVARQLENFREKMDNAFKQEAAAHYNEFMAYANDRCFNRIKQCNSKISSVGSVEIPSYENFWNFGCMECFVTSMRLIRLHDGDATLANMDSSNCLGKFCQALKAKRQHLAKIESDDAIHGLKNNALSADSAKFEEYRVNKRRKEEGQSLNSRLRVDVH